MTAAGTSTRSRTRTTPVSTDELAAVITGLTARLERAEQMLADQNPAGAAGAPADPDGQPPLYQTVEAWVTTYLLPTFPRPFGAVGVTRWHWCQQWWRHDEAVTRLTALWYAWEHARLEMTGMVGWLHELDHHLPILCGEDGPFRDCSAGSGDLGSIRHTMADIAEVQTAPAQWWEWWG